MILLSPFAAGKVKIQRSQVLGKDWSVCKEKNQVQMQACDSQTKASVPGLMGQSVIPQPGSERTYSSMLYVPFLPFFPAKPSSTVVFYSVLFFQFLLLFYIPECFPCMCVCEPRAGLVDMEAQRGCWILWIQSYRLLHATVEMLGAGPRSPAKVANPLNH